MNTRATVYFESQVHKALKLKAVEMGVSFSEIINRMAYNNLLEDQEDLATLTERAEEPTISYEAFLNQLKADGTL